MNLQKHSNEEPLAYVSTYNENNPELFTETILKISWKLKTMTK